MRLPERSLRIALLARGAMIWFLVRCMIATTSGVGSMVGGKAPFNPFALSVDASLATILIVGGLGLLEARRRNEDRFLANLGVSALTITLISMAPSCVAELSIAIAGPR